MNPNAFRDTLTRLAAAFPGAPMTDGTVDIWWEFFQTYDDADFATAATEWIGSMDRFPSIAQFKGAVGKAARVRRQQRITDEIVETAPRDRTGERNVAAVRDVLEAALRRDLDDHPEEAAAAAVAAARPVLTVGPPLPATRGHGCTQGFEELPEHPGTVIPCQVCNYPAYQRWEQRKYEPQRLLPR